MFQGPGTQVIGGARQFPGVQLGFPATLTSSFTSSTGYSWKRRILRAGTGTLDVSIPFTGKHAYALNNDEDLASGTVVWLEPTDGNGYLIVAASEDEGGGGAVGQCEGHGWLIDDDALEDAANLSSGNVPARVLHVNIEEGVGRCGCIEAQPPEVAAEDSLTAIYNSTAQTWDVLQLIETCCSCGRMKITIPGGSGASAGTFPPASAALTLFDACDASGTTYNFRWQCATETTFELAGHGPRLCNDTPDPIPCDNTFRAVVECADCDLESVECDACCNSGAPPWFHLPLSGFTGANSYLNGDWYLPWLGTAESCMWGIDCDGVTIGLTVTIDGANTEILLSLDGVTQYEFSAASSTFNCYTTRSLTEVAPGVADTPATVSLVAIHCDVITACCDNGLPATLNAVFSPMAGTNDISCLGMADDTIELVWDAAEQRYEGSQAISCSDCGGSDEFCSECETIRIRLYCDVGPAWVGELEFLDANGDPCGGEPTTIDFIFTTCCPFVVAFQILAPDNFQCCREGNAIGGPADIQVDIVIP